MTSLIINMPHLQSRRQRHGAMLLSGLCLVHCLAGSVLLTAFAASGGLLGHNVHVIGLLLALPLAAIALWRGIAVHGRWMIGVLGAIGIALMAASLLISHGGVAEVAVSIVGVCLLAAAHLWNLRASRG
jgi:hypothetical protein